MITYTTDDQYPEGGNFKAGDICECTNPEFPVKSWVYSGREWVPNSPASITNPASGLSIKSIWTGTQAQYDAIAVKDANTQYNTDAGIYVGDTLVSGGTLPKINSTARVSIAVVGDSIARNQYTYGSHGGVLGYSRTWTIFGAWLAFAAGKTAGRCYADIYACEGYSGERTDQIYSHLKPSTETEVYGVAETISIGIAARAQGIVVDTSGTNDLTQAVNAGTHLTTGLYAAVAGRRAIWAYIRQSGAVPVAMSLFPRNDGKAQYVPAWNAAMQAAAESDGVPWCDGYSVCAKADGTFKDGYTFHNGVDDILGLHPSTLASLAIAEPLAEIFNSIIASSPRIPRAVPGNPGLYSQSFRAGPGDYFKQFGDGAIPNLSDWSVRYNPQGNGAFALHTPTIDESGGGTIKFSKPASADSGYVDWAGPSLAVVAGQRYLFSCDLQLQLHDGYCGAGLIITDASLQPMVSFSTSYNDTPADCDTGVQRMTIEYRVPTGVTSIKPMVMINRSAGGTAGGTDNVFLANIVNLRIE